DRPFSSAGLAERLGILPQHHRLLNRMLGMLGEEGVLRLRSTDWEVERSPLAPDVQALWKGLIERYPAYHMELALLKRCEQGLAQVLRGELDPLQLIFAEGSLTTAEIFYEDSPSFRIYNLLTQKAIGKVVDRLPAGRSLRILEIGAGTGGVTSYVLPKLPPQRTEYV